MTVNNAKLEKHIVDIEYKLTIAAILPIAGQIAGALKVILGIIQAIGGLLGLIFSIPFLWHQKGREIFCRSGSHFVNGFANIGAGIVEATPIIGNVVAIARYFLYLSRDPHLGGPKAKCMIFGYRILNQLDDDHGIRSYGHMALIPV